MAPGQDLSVEGPRGEGHRDSLVKKGRDPECGLLRGGQLLRCCSTIFLVAHEKV